MSDSRDFNFVIILIGDDSHGKSYLVNNFCKIRFMAEYKPTIGVDFYVKLVHVLNKTTKLLIRELNNKERFRSHRAMYFRGASGVIINIGAHR
ncbi:MAG: hypothetical protein ACFFFB_14010 [Candidatus Heimdallarchaeota archaeon]